MDIPGFLSDKDYYLCSRKELENIKLVEYLMGIEIPVLTDTRLYDKSGRVPKLASPIKMYLNEVYRFLYSAGVRFNLATPTDTAKNIWLDNQIYKMGLISYLPQIWERAAVTGEVLLLAKPYKIRDQVQQYYKLHIYDKPNFSYQFDGDELAEVKIINTVEKDGEQYLYKCIIDRDKFRIWDLMPLNRLVNPTYTDYPHPYGFVPAVVVKNSSDCPMCPGIPDFDETSLDLAIELVLQTSYPATNYKYFGHPILTSPNPTQTLKALKAKIPVLQSEGSEDGGKPDALSLKPIPETHKEYLNNLLHNYSEHMGISLVDSTQIRDSSSLTLRMLFSKSISTADRKNQAIEPGLTELAEKMLLMAALDGILVDVFPSDPESYSILVHRNTNFFPISPQEKLQAAMYAEQLVNMGIRKEVALQEVFPDLSQNEIMEQLEGI